MQHVMPTAHTFTQSLTDSHSHSLSLSDQHTAWLHKPTWALGIGSGPYGLLWNAFHLVTN